MVDVRYGIPLAASGSLSPLLGDTIAGPTSRLTGGAPNQLPTGLVAPQGRFHMGWVEFAKQGGFHAHDDNVGRAPVSHGRAIGHRRGDSVEASKTQGDCRRRGIPADYLDRVRLWTSDETPLCT